MRFVEKGGKLMLYGPTAHAGQTFSDFMQIQSLKPVNEELNRQAGGELLRQALEKTGYSIRFNKLNPEIKSPVITIARHDNGFYFAGYAPNQTVEQLFRFPQGAPVFTGYTTEIRGGYSTYRMPLSWSRECRVFVNQPDGIVSCREIAPVEYEIQRKIALSGLENATVRIYPATDETHYKAMPYNNHYITHEERLPDEKGTDFTGKYYEYKNKTGELWLTW
jgi:hypothetical protein